MLCLRDKIFQWKCNRLQSTYYILFSCHSFCLNTSAVFSPLWTALNTDTLTETPWLTNGPAASLKPWHFGLLGDGVSERQLEMWKYSINAVNAGAALHQFIQCRLYATSITCVIQTKEEVKVSHKCRSSVRVSRTKSKNKLTDRKTKCLTMCVRFWMDDACFII